MFTHNFLGIKISVSRPIHNTMKTIIALTSLLALSQVNAQEYTEYNTLLKKYVNNTGVKYKAWAANSADKKALDTLLQEWAKIDANKLSKNDQAAFRINLYNAAMVDVVLDRYPLKSVAKIGADFSIFKSNIIQTPQGKISLDTLEKKTLLRDFPDARIHFAVNCASVSCPPLRAEAYTGKKLEEQLNAQSKLFANSKHAVQVSGNTAKYSELFNWYQKDFKTSNPATYLNKFRTNKLSTGLKKSWIKYDWNLNESK